MLEQLPPPEEKKKFSRRRFMIGAVGAAAATGALGVANTHDSRIGIRLNKPELRTRTKFAGKGVEGRQLFHGYVSVEDKKVMVTKTFDGRHHKVYFEPSGEFYVPSGNIEEVHRGGNSFEEVDESYEIGGNNLI